MVEFKLKPLKDNAYKKVADAIYNYVFCVGDADTFIIRLAIGKDSERVYYINEVVYKYNNDIEFFNDWWKGDPYVAVLGILPIVYIASSDFDDID